MSSPQKSSFKFPKALAAAGLAAVLVGCGGGSESASTTTEPEPITTPKEPITLASVHGFTPSNESLIIKAGESKKLQGGYHYLNCAAGGPDCIVTSIAENGTVTYTGGTLDHGLTQDGMQANADNDPDTGLAATHKKNIMNLRSDVLTAINTRSNYNVGEGDNPTATRLLNSFEAQLGTTDSIKYLSADDLAKYRRDVTNFRQRIADNAGPELWLDGIDAWNARVTNVDSLDPSIIPSTNNITVTRAGSYGDVTDVQAPPLVATNITHFNGKVGPSWTGRQFETAHRTGVSALKVFTTHQAPVEIGNSTWDRFWRLTGHYGENTTFGTGNPFVNLWNTAGNPGAPAGVTNIYGSIAVGDPRVTPELGNRTFVTASTPLIATPVAIPAASVTLGQMIGTPTVTKIHRNDITFRSDATSVVNIPAFTAGPLPIAPADGTTGTFGNDAARFSAFLGQAGGFSCETGGTNGGAGGAVQCGLSFNEDGFLVISLHATSTGATGGIAISTNDIAILKFVSDQNHAALASNVVGFTRPDTTYMTMGYWMSADGTIIDTFANGRYWYGDNPETPFGLTVNSAGANNIGGVSGDATYTGQAVGAYAMNTGSDGTLELDNGEFHAQVTLNANFGASASTNVNPFTVSGSISSFKSLTDSSHNSHIGRWGLTLDPTTTNNPGGSFRGATTGSGGSKIENAWQGQFYGNTGLATTTVADNFPAAAVGEFKGDFGNENKAVGVFGVEK